MLYWLTYLAIPFWSTYWQVNILALIHFPKRNIIFTLVTAKHFPLHIFQSLLLFHQSRSDRCLFSFFLLQWLQRVPLPQTCWLPPLSVIQAWGIVAGWWSFLNNCTETCQLVTTGNPRTTWRSKVIKLLSRTITQRASWNR